MPVPLPMIRDSWPVRNSLVSRRCRTIGVLSSNWASVASIREIARPWFRNRGFQHRRRLCGVWLSMAPQQSLRTLRASKLWLWPVLLPEPRPDLSGNSAKLPILQACTHRKFRRLAYCKTSCPPSTCKASNGPTKFVSLMPSLYRTRVIQLFWAWSIVQPSCPELARRSCLCRPSQTNPS